MTERPRLRSFATLEGALRTLRKAPLPLLKKMFGKSVLGEVVQETVEGSVSEHLQEQGHRPAQQPDIKIANENFDQGDDLNVEISYECLPEVPDVDYSEIKLERKTVEVDETSVEEAMGSEIFRAQHPAIPSGDLVQTIGDRVVAGIGDRLLDAGNREW